MRSTCTAKKIYIAVHQCNLELKAKNYARSKIRDKQIHIHLLMFYFMFSTLLTWNWPVYINVCLNKKYHFEQLKYMYKQQTSLCMVCPLYNMTINMNNKHHFVWCVPCVHIINVCLNKKFHFEQLKYMYKQQTSLCTCMVCPLYLAF